MKKSLHLKKNTAYRLVLFLLLFTSMAYAQPPIANPNPYYVCDDNNDGIGVFDLSTQITTVLNGLSPNDYTLTFYQDSNYTTPITNPTAYSASNGAIIYIQVVENTNVTNSATTTLQLQVNQLIIPTFSPMGPICSGNSSPILPTTSTESITGTWTPPIITSVGTTTYTFEPNPGQCATANFMTISVYQSPTANTPPNLYQVNPSGIATFDLTVQIPIITGNQTNAIVTFYPSYNDAISGTNAISNPSSFVNTLANQQTIGVRVVDASSGCYSITSFQIIVANPNPNFVFIPDTNFKTKLITLGIDTNSDGEIGYDEALVPTTLDVSYSQISDMTGIEYFTNLQSLYCNNNNITSLNCSNLTHLTYLMCDYNQIYNLNLSGITTLITLFCTNNQLSSLDVSSATNLHNLQCDTNHLTTLNTTGLTNLQYLSCYQNSLSSINVSGMINLQSLDCRNNQITSLNLSGLGNLQILNCNTNQLTSLDVSQSPNLSQLACSDNLFTNLDLSAYTHLTYLACGNAQLSSIDVSNLLNLNIFYFYGSQQSTLNMDNLTNLTGFYCYNSNLTSIDVSHSTNLVFNNFTLSNNQSLTYLNMKNGVVLGVPTINYCPNLLYVCAEEGILTSVGVALFDITTTNNPNVQINSYCSFVPGGNYNTITGVLHFDSNNNGCDSNDVLSQQVRMNISTNGTNSGATFANYNGDYSFFVGTGSFQITPEIENSNWFTFSPSSATVNFTNNNNNTNTQNFCISPNGSHQDVEIILAPITPARPGFDAIYLVTYRNKGNQILTMNNGIGFIYNANQMSFVSSTTTPSSFVNGTISWDVANLLPFESRSFYIIMNINSPLGTAPVAIGDILNFTVTIALQSNDENMADNTSILHQTVVGAYDPNSVTCVEGDSLPPSEIGNYLHYVINFENTGNYQAENVVVKDIIDTTKYDINTLQLLSSSNPVYTRINGNNAEFIFENINLAAQGGNPPVGGHGNVLFKIKSNNTLQSGDFVSKEANIYFDYNAPILTNTSQTTYAVLNNSIHQLDNSIAIYPNPTASAININCNSAIKTVEVFDLQGRLLETSIVNNINAKIDLSSRMQGIYFLKITSDKGGKVEKVIKE